MNLVTALQKQWTNKYSLLQNYQKETLLLGNFLFLFIHLSKFYMCSYSLQMLQILGEYSVLFHKFINRFSEKIKFLLIKIIHIFSVFYIYEVKSNEIVIFRVFTLISNWLTSHFWDTSFKTFRFCCQYFDFAF